MHYVSSPAEKKKGFEIAKWENSLEAKGTYLTLTVAKISNWQLHKIIPAQSFYTTDVIDNTMAQERSRKRKAGVADADEAVAFDDDEFDGELLDGVLSASEGEEEEEEEEEDESERGSEDGDEFDEDPDEEEGENESNKKDDDDDDDKHKIPYRTVADANGGVRYEYREIEPVYDSDDSDTAPANTIGNIPLSFYDSYPHIGYDINGKRIMRPAAGDALDALLDSIEVPAGWTGLTDPATGRPLELSRDELELLRRLQTNEAPEGFDPYPVRVS